MDNNQGLFKEIIKTRLDKIKEKKAPSTINQSSSSSSLSTMNTYSSVNNAKLPTDASPKIEQPFNQEDLKETLKQALNNSSNNSKEKLGLFVQQANECFQNYEKEIGELKHQLDQSAFFQNSKLVIANSASTIAFSLCPTHEQVFNIQMNKLTEKEGVTLDEIQREYNKKITELFQENASLSIMIDKLSFDVVNTLQEKIQELDNLLKKEKTEKETAQKQLKSMDSVFQQNSDMKASLLEKDKVIVSLHSQLTEAQGQIQEQKTDISTKAKAIASQTKTIEAKDKKIKEQSTEIDELKKTITKQFESLNSQKNDLKEKDEEIQILFNDNLQWEDKYKLQSKEIENFKKWSLWDEDLIESYKKIEDLNNTLLHKEESINNMTEQIESLMKSNEEFLADVKAKKKEIQDVRNENDTLNIIKLNYEKEKEKFENYEVVSKENASFKKEMSKTIEKFESEMKTEKKNHESQMFALTKQHEFDINKLTKDNEARLTESNTLIQAYECKFSNSQNELKELTNQFDKKNELLTNLKEVYDNMVKKLKTQEDKIQSIEKGDCSPMERKIDEKPKAKVYSTFDKFAFTKEIMVDYLFCLFLFESSVNIQHLLDFLLRNINTYFHTIFQKHLNPQSIVSEMLEDVFFIAFDKLLNSKIQSNSSGKNEYSYKINFEQFNRETINEICEEIISNNPLSRFKNKKTLEEIEELFLSKYAKSFDFDEGLETYLSENIMPLVASRIEKYEKVIFDDAHTLVEISLNNIKEGLVVVDKSEVYSYEHFFNEYKYIASTKKEKENEEDEEEPESLSVNGELRREEAVDNILFRIKYYEPLEVSFNGVFNKNSEMVLTKIITSIILYSPSIELLSLKNNQLGGYLMKDYICKAICLFKDLKTLDMTNNQINDDDFKLVCEELKANKTIDTLIVDNNNLTSASGFYLGDVLLVNKTLETLSLNNNQLSESGLSTLLQVLANKNSLITQLSIGYNNLTQEDFSALGDFLSDNRVVTSLDISGNNLDPQSANIIGVAFRKAKSLITLKANFIGLNEVSSAQFLNFINETNIETIELDKNLFGEDGTILLINKIKASAKLKRISLRMCEISSTYLGLIGQLIKSNTTLEELNLESNLFNDESILSFCKTIEGNQKISITFSMSNMSKKAIDAIKPYTNVLLS